MKKTVCVCGRLSGSIREKKSAANLAVSRRNRLARSKNKSPLSFHFAFSFDRHGTMCPLSFLDRRCNGQSAREYIVSKRRTQQRPRSQASKQTLNRNEDAIGTHPLSLFLSLSLSLANHAFRLFAHGGKKVVGRTTNHWRRCARSDRVT